MMITHPASILRSLYPSLDWKIDTDQKELFLTFDDGPIKGVTERLLDLLQAHNAKATFFCIGKNVKKNPEIFERIIQEGHTVGNHTFNHSNGWKSTNMSYLKDVQAFQELYQSPYFRPPYGKMKPAQIAALKKQYKIMMWSALSMDFHPSVSAEKCYENANSKLKAGDILLFHDSEKAGHKMMYAVERILKERSIEGYKFSSISH